jgi:acyl dehydratase
VGRLLHGEQRYEYHHPIYAGDTLTVTTRPGKAWEKAGKRGGMMKFAESVTEYRNQDGVLCVTATSVGIETEHTVEQ